MTEVFMAETEVSSCGCGCTARQATEAYRRTIVLVAAAALFLGSALGIESWYPEYTVPGTVFALLSLSVTAIPIFREAISGIFQGERNVCELAALAIIGAVIIGEYTTAAEISFILAIGELVEQNIYARSRRDIEGIISRHPRYAHVLVDGSPVQTEVSGINPGDLVMVRPGDVVPVDGIIREGTSDLDESCLTGESLPVTRRAGEFVNSGATNLEGLLIIEALRSSDASTYAQIVDLVDKAGKRRPPTHPFIDRFSRWYTPVMLVISGIILVWTGSVERAITVLIVACPCAILLATPSATLAAIGHAAKKGILVKGSEYLELCRDITAVVFDKTGTLSTGEMAVIHVYPASGFSREDILGIAGALERTSGHPIAKAIVREAERSGSTGDFPGQVRQIPGMGLEGELGGDVIHIGSRQYIQNTGTDIPRSGAPEEDPSAIEIFISKNRKTIGSIVLADQLRPEIPHVLSGIRSLGIDYIGILTGDNGHTAHLIGQRCSIPQDRIHAGLVPAEKEEYLEQIQASGRKVCFVGDGTNDGPALARADLGVSIAGREDTVALETAGVVLMQGGLVHLPDMLRLGRRTSSIIIVNVIIALVLNAILILCASLGMISPAAGAIGHQASTICVLLNSLRLVPVRSGERRAQKSTTPPFFRLFSGYCR